MEKNINNDGKGKPGHSGTTIMPPPKRKKCMPGADGGCGKAGGDGSIFSIKLKLLNEKKTMVPKC